RERAGADALLPLLACSTTVAAASCRRGDRQSAQAQGRPLRDHLFETIRHSATTGLTWASVRECHPKPARARQAVTIQVSSGVRIASESGEIYPESRMNQRKLAAAAVQAALIGFGLAVSGCSAGSSSSSGLAPTRNS